MICSRWQSQGGATAVTQRISRCCAPQTHTSLTGPPFYNALGSKILTKDMVMIGLVTGPAQV